MQIRRRGRGSFEDAGAGGGRATRALAAVAALALVAAACGGGSDAPAAAPQPSAPQPASPAPAPEEASDVELIEITPELIAAAQAEGSLLVRSSVPAGTMDGIARAFQEQYGIVVENDRAVGVVGVDKFRQEERAGQHVVDVMWNVDPPGLLSLYEEGFLTRFTTVDADTALPEEAFLGGGVGYVTYWYDVVISYNPSLIPHEVAKEKFSTWEGLLDADLAGGLIGMNEPAGGSIPYGTYLMFLRLPQYGEEFLEKLAAQEPRLYPGSAPGREDLAAGAIAVYIPNWEDIAMLNFVNGDQTAWTYPEITPAIPAAFVSFSANAPSPNAARLFSAWMLSEDGAAAFRGLQARPTRLDSPDTRSALDLLRQTDWWEPFPQDRFWVPDREDWDSNYAELMPEMRRILGWDG